MKLTKKGIIYNIKNELNITNNESKDFLEGFLNLVKENINKKKIKINNFGSFQIKVSPERPGRNPKTKESYIIPKRNRMIFRASNKIKDLLN